MPSDSAAPSRASFEMKSAQLPLVALVLRSHDIAAVGAELQARLADDPQFFAGEPVVIDVAALDGSDAITAVDLDAVLALLREHGMAPLALRGGSPTLTAAAVARGLVDAPEAVALRHAVDAVEAIAQPPVQVHEIVREVVRDAPLTMVIDKPLRSGQQVYARGGDLVVMAAVNHGAEVIADGNIHVYAPLRGKAIAGARGNTSARIFSTCLDAELISIAGIYRTSENPLPDSVAGKPAQVRLLGEKLVMEPL